MTLQAAIRSCCHHQQRHGLLLLYRSSPWTRLTVGAKAQRRCLSGESSSSSSSAASNNPSQQALNNNTATTTSSSAPLKKKRGDPQPNLLLRVGAPFVLFSILASWTVSNALEGRIKEMETAKGKATKSLRQAALEVEHEDMMERLNKIVDQDFDNTKRIKRPHEILEERRAEREKRNAWHRRLYRSVFGESRPT